MFLTRASIANPVFATMMMAALLVLGIFSYNRLSVEQLPDITFPVAVVLTPYPGASAEAVEQDVTRKIEQAVNTVSGVRTIRSNSRQNFSSVVVEFELNVEPRAAIQDVRDKVAEVKLEFNKDVGEPSVQKADNDNDQPIVELSFMSDARSLRELSDLSESLVIKRLQGIQGVGSVTVEGGVQRELSVWLKPDKMAAYGVAMDQIIGALRAENQDVPAGSLISNSTERVVRVLGKLKTAQDFERIIVARRGNGANGGTSPVLLGQLAEIKDGQAEETSISTINGKRRIGIDIRKAKGGNSIEIAAAVRKQVAELKKTLPADSRLEVTVDRSEWIKDSVDNVRRTIMEGALLTIAIVFLFLHSWRSTVITGLALPISVIGTFTAMYAFGFTLNFMTLLALSLSIGVLIDDAIVVRENIVRHVRMGKDHYTASLEATNEIGLAVLATTFSIVAVFVPVAFMGGIIGKFFYQFGVTVSVAVLVSLFVSFTLDPMLSSVWQDPPSKWLTHGPIGWILNAQAKMLDWFHRVYDRALVLALRFRKATLALAAGVFLASFALVPLIGSEFIPESDEGWTGVRIQTPIGSSLDYTSRKVQQVEAALKDIPEIKRVFANINRTSAWLSLDLGPRKERKRSQKQIDDAVRERVSRIAGLEATIGWNRPIRLYVLGPDVGTLGKITDELMAKMRAIDGIVDLESSLKPTNPTLDIVVKREQASDLGVSMNQIAITTRALIAGEPVGQWQGPDGENHPIRLRLPKSERQEIVDLDKIYVASYSFNADATPRMVPLRQIADFVPSYGERNIERRDLQRQVNISAGVKQGKTVGDIDALVKKAMQEINLPAGYRFHQGGSAQDMAESMKHAVAALLLAVVFIYLILASQFGSFMQPLAIMASLPLSLIGVFAALAIFRSTLNLFSVIGFIMLMGLVTKNAILLVDFANHAVKLGHDRFSAIREAAQVRLRPILMTSAAMVFGMLPLALALGDGSEMQSPMAHAVIGGIITSTVLTLVVVPVLYTYLDTFGEWATRKLSREKHVTATSAAPNAAPDAAD